MNSFLARIKESTLLGDGAMGTLLYTKDIAYDQCLEALIVEQPDLIAEIHLAYVDAGADYITTHTFGANRRRLARFGLEGLVGKFNRRAVEVASAAGAAAHRQVLIAGNVGPLGERVDWRAQSARRAAESIFAEQVAALAEAGIDFLLFETFSDLVELEIAINAARHIGGESGALPLVASMSYGVDGLTLAGQDVVEVTRRLVSAGVEVVGANCSVGPAQMVATLQLMRQSAPGKALSVTPNAGLPTFDPDGHAHYPLGPGEFAGYVSTYLDLGAKLIGGCCGTTPQHIREMAAMLNGRGH